MSALALVCACASLSRAQDACGPGGVPTLVGSERERSQRVSQLLGSGTRQPFTLRPFGPRQWDDLATPDSAPHWEHGEPGVTRARCVGFLRLDVLPARVRLVYNTAFPTGKNDGAIWEGRGATAAIDGGFVARAGSLTLTVAPLAFVAENRAYDLTPNGYSGTLAFADWRNPDRIDLPQRFGARAYRVLNPGQSSLRADVGPVAIGVTTANEFWGPAIAHPIVLGNNAAGFPRLFAGTSRPLAIPRTGELHARVFWGRLSQSPFATSGGDSTRLASGVAVVFQPGFAPGLEIGGARFFHVQQRRFALTAKEIARPLRGGTPTSEESEQNQLASVFARLVLPADGAELYGEFGKEDRNNDLREFWLVPDHDAAYLIGIQKAWRRERDVTVFRAEVLNGRMTHLALSTSQQPWYVHGALRQGHTNEGQALGSAALYGGGGSIIAVDRYSQRGRVTISWERLLLGEYRPATEYAPDPTRADVVHQWTASRLLFSRRADVELSLGAIHELNRRFGEDGLSWRPAVTLLPPSRARAR